MDKYASIKIESYSFAWAFMIKTIQHGGKQWVFTAMPVIRCKEMICFVFYVVHLYM